MNNYHATRHHADETFDLINYLLDRLAFSSEKTIASIVLLLSMIPETFGVASAQGYAVGVVSASVSLVTVKLALRDKGKVLTLPVIGKRRLYFGWALYGLNLIAGLAFVYSTGVWVDLFLIVVSFCGAVSSEQIASIIKAESRERSTVDLKTEKDAIKLANWKQAEEAKQAARMAKLNGVQGVQQGANFPTDVQQDKVGGLTEEGRRRGKEARQSAADERRLNVYRTLLENYAGEEVDSINKSELARQFDVAQPTIARDIKALRERGMLNGVVA